MVLKLKSCAVLHPLTFTRQFSCHVACPNVSPILLTRSNLLFRNIGAMNEQRYWLFVDVGRRPVCLCSSNPRSGRHCLQRQLAALVRCWHDVTWRHRDPLGRRWAHRLHPVLTRLESGGHCCQVLEMSNFLKKNKFRTVVGYLCCKICVCLCADGQWLACGSRDNSIYIYAVTESGRKFTRAAKCSVSYCPRSKYRYAFISAGILVFKCAAGQFLRMWHSS